MTPEIEPKPLAVAPPTITDIIAQVAMRGGTESLDAIKALLDAKERIDRDEAAKAFAAAITEFQRRCPQIYKSREAYTATYAALEDIMVVVKPILSDLGIAVTFTMSMEGPAEKPLTKCACRVRVGTHVETTDVFVPTMQAQKGTNDTQAMGAVVSYAKRYALCAALNIITTKEDNDAATEALLTKVQVAEISRLISACQNPTVAHEGLLKWAKADTLEDVPASKYAEACRSLKAKAKPEKQATIPGTEPTREQP